MTPYKNYFLAYALFLVLASCSEKNDENQIMTRPLASEVQVTFPKGGAKQNDQTRRTRVVIQSIEGYGQDEGFAREAAALLEEVINSPEFRAAVIANRYDSDNGLSPEEIYEKIMKAHEEDGPGGNDYVIDLRLRIINSQQDGPKWMKRCDPNSSAGTIGIDGGGTGIAAVCPQWLRSTAQANKKEWLAAHFMHEYMHILNFSHPGKKSRTVPYKIHYIVEELGVKLNPTT
jgi:hypothetical protein